MYIVHSGKQVCLNILKLTLMKQALLFRSFFVVFKSQVTIKGCLIIKKRITK